MFRDTLERLHFVVNHPHRPYRLWKWLSFVTAPRADWNQPFSELEKKWHFVPSGPDSWLDTQRADEVPVEELAKMWEQTFKKYTEGANYEQRGWYHDKYTESLKGKKVLDVGSGFAVDTLRWARQGAKVTFVDMVAANLEVTRRLVKHYGIEANYLHLKQVEDLKSLPNDFDFVFALGSLHHAPFSVVQPEVQELLRHVKKGGRWIQLAYPKSRWESDDEPDFSKWGILTDGRGTPWAEWYDLEKMAKLFSPRTFKVHSSFEFAGGQFIWFDLELE